MVIEELMKVISNLLRKIADDIDYGNSNLNENEAISMIETIK